MLRKSGEVMILALPSFPSKSCLENFTSYLAFYPFRAFDFWITLSSIFSLWTSLWSQLQSSEYWLRAVTESYFFYFHLKLTWRSLKTGSSWALPTGGLGKDENPVLLQTLSVWYRLSSKDSWFMFLKCLLSRLWNIQLPSPCLCLYLEARVSELSRLWWLWFAYPYFSHSLGQAW